MDIELEQLTAAIHDDELDFDFGNDDTLIVPEDDDLAIDSFFNASSDHEDDTDEILSLRSFQFGDDDFDGEFGDDLSDYSFSSSEESIDGSWDDEWRGRKKKRGQKYKRERKKQHAVEGRVCAAFSIASEIVRKLKVNIIPTTGNDPTNVIAERLFASRQEEIKQGRGLLGSNIRLHRVPNRSRDLFLSHMPRFRAGIKPTYLAIASATFPHHQLPFAMVFPHLSNGHKFITQANALKTSAAFTNNSDKHWDLYRQSDRHALMKQQVESEFSRPPFYLVSIQPLEDDRYSLKVDLGIRPDDQERYRSRYFGDTSLKSLINSLTSVDENKIGKSYPAVRLQLCNDFEAAINDELMMLKQNRELEDKGDGNAAKYKKFYLYGQRRKMESEVKKFAGCNKSFLEKARNDMLKRVKKKIPKGGPQDAAGTGLKAKQKSLNKHLSTLRDYFSTSDDVELDLLDTADRPQPNYSELNPWHLSPSLQYPTFTRLETNTLRRITQPRIRKLYDVTKGSKQGSRNALTMVRENLLKEKLIMDELNECDDSHMSEVQKLKLIKDKHNVKERVRRVLITHYLERLALLGFGSQDDKVTVLHSAWTFFKTLSTDQRLQKEILKYRANGALAKTFGELAEQELREHANSVGLIEEQHEMETNGVSGFLNTVFGSEGFEVKRGLKKPKAAKRQNTRLRDPKGKRCKKSKPEVSRTMTTRSRKK